MSYYVLWDKNGPSIRSAKHLRICRECKHYDYNSGSMCKRIDPPVHNVITGVEYKSFSSVFIGTSCQNERYSTSKENCGIEGRFWKPS
jgi:hypothetical protein